MKLSTAIFVGSAAAAGAHMCTFEPIQRGGVVGADQPHANVCFQQTGPCPITTAGAPVAAYVQGEKVRLTLQKNLDHYQASSPGNFSAFMWNSTGGSIFWGSVPDTPAPTLSLYYMDLTVPATLPPGAYVLQSIYSTNNPGAPPNFYQCSDVTVLAAPTAEAQSAPVDHAHAHGQKQSLRA